MISKVKDVMNANKQVAYKIWLDELNTTPSEAFFPTFRQFLDLLIKDNPAKVEIIRNRIDGETRQLVHSANEAAKELENLLEKVEQEAEKQKIKSLPEIDHFKQVKNGEIEVTGEDLPDTLYHAIRLTIEAHRNNGKLKAFDDLISENENFWYLDYAKVCESYPSYKKFKDTKDAFTQKQKEAPWGAYTYLRWATTFFKEVSPEQAGSFVKTDIISNLRRFILYLLTPEVTEDKKATEKIPYSLSEERGVLKIGNQEIRFKKETRKFSLLAALVKEPKGIYYGEIAEEIEGATYGKTDEIKNKYYEVCRGIEVRLLKSGITDFLIFNYNKAAINPLYRKTPK